MKRKKRKQKQAIEKSQFDMREIKKKKNQESTWFNLRKKLFPIFAKATKSKKNEKIS
jgi:hypothetical protein